MSETSNDCKVAPVNSAVPEAIPEKLSRRERLSSAFTIACSGFALISDGLQNNIMSLTNVVFVQLFGSAAYNAMWSTQLSNSLTVGTILGQLVIGYICDVKGRKWGIVLSTVLIVIGIVLCTAAHAEAANERMLKNRGPVFILVTNLTLSFGAPLACILYLIVFQAAGGLAANLNTVWRTVFGISAVPPLIVFYFRLKMLDSVLYRKGAIQKNIPYLLTLRYYWKSLIGTAGAWFLYVSAPILAESGHRATAYQDFIDFPNGVFSGVIISSIVKAEGHELVRKTAEYQMLLGMIAIPGCFVGAALPPWTEKYHDSRILWLPHLCPGLAVGLAYNKVVGNVAGFVVLYGLMNSFGNAGPGDMLGLTSSESYATAVRGTCYGFSAAVGKTGAVLGTQAFTPIRNNLGARWTFIIAAICGLAGMLVTVLFIRNDLGGDLAEEDATFAAFLEENGWSGEMGASESIVDLVVVTEKGEKSDD
ncbi:major facilitator superfamily domain-containing protein [Mycena polygramma]|nr:major facilitator superfamily domain-containing protein [Mycena polygramma]